MIAFLWRPTNNNHRYAFIPLLENDEDEDEDQFISPNYSDIAKLRVSKNPQQPAHEENFDDETIRWVEENIANVSTSMLLDSDEDLENTKFEISKMQ